MRSNGNFHAEWGYLAPSSNFIRTARIALVAVVLGGIAGAGVVLTLVERPPRESSVAARTLPRDEGVASVPIVTPRAAQMTPQAVVQDQPTSPAPIDESGSRSSASPNSQPPTSGIAVEVPPAKAVSPARARFYRAPVTDRAPTQKKATRKFQPTSRYASRGEHVYGDRGPRRPFEDQSLFGANVPAEYYPRRGYGGYYGEQRWGDYYPNGGFDYR